MTQQDIDVTGGVDTHKDTHTAAALDGAGRVLGTEQFAANQAGYKALLAWLRSFGPVPAVGVEGHRRLRVRAPPGSGCPQLHETCCDRPEAKVSHLHSNQQRLTAQGPRSLMPSAARGPWRGPQRAFGLSSR
jgi:Transposase